MITLFIDTSSTDVSIAILKEDTLLCSVTKNVPGIHSKYTVNLINELLEKQHLIPKNIERIMVVTGPGSFTGLRIGVTIAKVYAFLENIEIIPISSLKMRSLSLEHKYCLSIIDAHHNNYYVGLYNEKNLEVIKEQFMKKEKVLELIHEYHPIIVSDLDGKIENISYQKQNLNFSSITAFYKNQKPLNPHLVNPNYLKLPQALEEKND